MTADPYKVLGVNSNASSADIKSAYRKLVKQHHPDTGGDEQIILSINAAWEILGDPDHRKTYDLNQSLNNSIVNEAKQRGVRNARASAAAKAAQSHSAAADNALLEWLQQVYLPIDRLLGQVINTFPSKLQDLSKDPYDDELMESFCTYLEKSQHQLEKVAHIFGSMPTPISAQDFGLDLYRCLSQVKDALNELQLYTMGYVDSYLHDGREMLREAKQKRLSLQEERRRLKVS